MTKTGWRGWLGSVARTIGGKRERLHVRRNTRRAPSRRLELERLEDRLAPATNITIITGAAGTGQLDHFLDATHGTITTADDPGTSETLSVGALQSVGSGTTISITADSTLNFGTVASDMGNLALLTGAGVNARFATNTGAINSPHVADNISTAGGSLTFSAGANLTVPNLNTNGGDVSLTAGTAGAGNLQFGNILTSGSGNLTFQAGSSSGTITQSGSTSAAVGQAISATAVGNISVNSLRGTTVSLTSFSSSVNSSGASPIQGSAQVTLSAATGINVFILTPSIRATNTTSGNVIISQLPPPNQDLTVVGSGVNNSAAGGIISLTNSAGDLSIASGSKVTTKNGTIFLSGTGLDLAAGTVNSGAAATELHNALSGLAFDVGHKVVGKIGLTQADLDAITASLLRIGTNSVSSINVSAAIHGDASWNNTLALIANGPITEAAAGSLTLANLRVTAVGPVTLTSVNNVQNLSASVTGTENLFAINNGTNTLTIPNAGVDAVLGVTTNNGNIDLIADNILIGQVVTPGTGTVILEPFTQTLNITLGTASVAGTTFGITNGGLGWITSGVTQIGVAADTGTIAITGAINRTPTSTAPSRSQTLSLVTGNATTNPLVSSTTGAITQTATLSVANLATQSVGGVQLTNAGNDVDTVAGSVTGGVVASDNFRLVDAPAVAGTTLTVGTVAGISGISTASATFLELTTTNALTLTNGLTTGNGGAVGLSSGGATTQGATASAAINASNSVSLIGTGPYTLTNVNNNTGDLSAKTTNGVSYTNAGALNIGHNNYVDGFAAPGFTGVTTNGGDINITVGAVTSGSTLTVTNPIDTTSTANITLSADRMTLSAAVNAHAGIVTLKPTAFGRAIDLGTNSSTANLGLLQTDLNNVTAGILRIGDLGTTGSITVTAAITDVGTGWSTLSLLTELGAGISQNAAATLTVINLNAAGNTGVTLNENNVVSKLAGATQSGAFSFVDSTNLTVDNVDSGLGSGFGIGIITQGQTVSLTVNVLNDSLTVNQHIDTTHNFGIPAPGGANINLSADNMALNNNSPASTINAGTAGIVTLTPFTSTNTIAVGGADAAGTLGIDDNDLANVTAKAVRIGSTAQTGAITVGGTITAHAGYNTLDLIATGALGAITQTTGSIAVANLALQASAGIGSAGAIQVIGPISVAFRNSTSNNAQITSTGALTIAAVDQLDGTTGHTIGNFATGGTETLTASSPMTFAVNDTSSGTITATTTETASEANPGGQLPPPDDDLIVNGGVTVESTGGNVSFTSGDGVNLKSGSTVKSDTGSVSLTVGSGDNDNDAALTINGAISAANVSLSSPGDIVLGQISATGTLSVTSTGGSIRDDGNDATFIEAANISLTAANAIGGDTQISRNDVLTQDAVFKQAIDFDLEGGTLTLSQTGSGGNIQLRNIDGTTNTSVLGGVEPVGAGNQLALIASGGGFANDPGNAAGDLVVDAALSVGANNDNLLLASTNGNHVTVSHAVTNTGTGTVTLVASSPVNVNAAITAVGSINLTSAGNASGDGVFIAANVTALGSGSTITVDANRDVNISGTNTALATTAATGGAITVTSAEGLPNFPTGGTGVVNMGATTSINTSANNSTITVDAGTTAGNGGDITLAVVNAGAGAVNVKSFAGSIVDGNGSANNVTGGAVNLSAGGAAGINLDVVTTTPATAGVTATTASGNIALRSTQQLQVDNISAGTSHDVSLTVSNNNTATSSITSLHPNDNVADVTGRTVTLTANGTANGATGQIGFFTSSAQFFEVAATTINAATNNSRLWISAIGGAAVGSITAGTDFAILKTVNGDLTSTHTGANVTTPDVTGGTVVLASPGTSGSFGSAANPLQVQTANLRASVTGAGSINVRNVAAGGNLNVASATTTNGAINLTVAGGNLTTTATSGTDINAPGNTVTLTVSGNVVSGTGAGVTDVGAANLAVSGTGAASGIGTSANPLKTAVSAFAASVGTGGVFVTNTGAALTLGTVGALSGVTATGGNITISTNHDLTVSLPVSTAGAVTLTGGTAAGSNINVNAAITGQTATVLGGTGADVIHVTTTGATPLAVNGQGGGDSIIVDFGALNAAVNVNETGGGNNQVTLNGTNAGDTFGVTGAQTTDGAHTVNYSGIQGVTVNGGSGSDTFNVTPSAAIPLTVNGGLPNPPALPGDTLNVNLTGTTNPTLIKTFSRATGYSGSWAFANRQDVNFTGIESLLPPEASTAVLKADGELDLYNTVTGQLQVLSPASTILSASAVQAGDGSTDVFAITSGFEGAQYQNTLWEFSTVFGWSQLSTSAFAQISAATNSAGQGVVFGVRTDGSLEEQDPANGTGLDKGFTLLSPSGTIVSVSAVTDLSGNPTVYAVVTANHNLWEHSPALAGNGWMELSTGSFQQVSAGLNGAGQAVVYGVVNGGSLWEQDPAVGSGLNMGWTQLSGTAGAPTTFLSAAAGRPNEVFGIAADHTLWEHTASGFRQLSTGSFAQVSPSETAAQDLAFATLTDGEFWEYDAGLLPGNPWMPVMANGQPVTGVASSSTT